MNSQLAWYVARSTGMVGWALLTASVLWGLAISTKATVGGRRLRPSWMLDMHRTLVRSPRSSWWCTWWR